MPRVTGSPSPDLHGPEIAGVGLTEAQAAERYGAENIAVGRFPWVANARAVMTGETAGWVEVDPRDDLRRARRRRHRRTACDGPHRGGCRRARRGGDDRDHRRRHGPAPDPLGRLEGGRSGGPRTGDPPPAAAVYVIALAPLPGLTGRILGYPPSMKIYTRRNAAIGYLTMKAARHELNKRRRKRSGLRTTAYVTLGLLSAGSSRPCSSSRCDAGTGTTPRSRASEGERDRRRVRHRTGARSRRVTGAGPGDGASLIRTALAGLVSYEPGKPVEEVQRELGLERIVKLASNEGPFGPFPAAQEAIARATLELNRYPDGGAWRLRTCARRAARGRLRAGHACAPVRTRSSATSAWRRSIRATRS